MVEPRFPTSPFGLVVTLGPHLDGGEHAHDLFLADLERASESMMRRAVDPRGLQQGLVADHQARALRSTEALATAVADHCGPALEVHVRDSQDLGGGVHE